MYTLTTLSQKAMDIFFLFFNFLLFWYFFTPRPFFPPRFPFRLALFQWIWLLFFNNFQIHSFQVTLIHIFNRYLFLGFHFYEVLLHFDCFQLFIFRLSSEHGEIYIDCSWWYLQSIIYKSRVRMLKKKYKIRDIVLVALWSARFDSGVVVLDARFSGNAWIK